MLDPRLPLAWIAVVAAAILLFGSLTGHGTGPWGLVAVRHMGWTYIMLLAAVALVLVLTRPPDGPVARPAPMADRDLDP